MFFLLLKNKHDKLPTKIVYFDEFLLNSIHNIMLMKKCCHDYGQTLDYYFPFLPIYLVWKKKLIGKLHSQIVQKLWAKL